MWKDAKTAIVFWVQIMDLNTNPLKKSKNKNIGKYKHAYAQNKDYHKSN